MSGGGAPQPAVSESSLRASIRSQKREGGFTLLETLIAVTVLALLMIGLSQGVRTGYEFWSAQGRRIGEVGELDSTARLLRSLLTGIPIRPAAAGATPLSIGLEGGGGQLAFVGDLPSGFGGSRRSDITISLRGGQLMLTWTPHRHEQGVAQPTVSSEVELIRGVENLEFAYWAATGGAAPGWMSEWTSPALPELIRIRLRFGKGDRRRWPDLIAAPQLSAPGS